MEMKVSIRGLILRLLQLADGPHSCRCRREPPGNDGDDDDDGEEGRDDVDDLGHFSIAPSAVNVAWKCDHSL